MPKNASKPCILKAQYMEESLIFFHGPSHKADKDIPERKSDIKTLKRISARQLH